MKRRSCPPYQRSKPLVMPPKYCDPIFPSVMGGTGRCDLWIPLIRKPRMSGTPGKRFTKQTSLEESVACRIETIAALSRIWKVLLHAKKFGYDSTCSPEREEFMAEPDFQRNSLETEPRLRPQPAIASKNYFGLLIGGGALGWLIGLSASPVVGTVVAAVIAAL